MTTKENEKSVSEVHGLNQFEPGHRSGPIDDAVQREERLNSLSESEKELATESAKFADLWQYFSQRAWTFRRTYSMHLGASQSSS